MSSNEQFTFLLKLGCQHARCIHIVCVVHLVNNDDGDGYDDDDDDDDNKYDDDDDDDNDDNDDEG